jgi:hypothetical protein
MFSHWSNDIAESCKPHDKYSVSQYYVDINGLFFSCRWNYAMGDRLTLEQRRVVVGLMEVCGSPTAVSQEFA